jgi:hypothetical protein
MNTDVDAVVYMMLMNNMIHDLFPNAVVIGKRQVSPETYQPHIAWQDTKVLHPYLLIARGSRCCCTVRGSGSSAAGTGHISQYAVPSPMGERGLVLIVYSGPWVVGVSLWCLSC